MDDLIAHIEHFLSLSGESTVAIGGDLDGCEALAAGMTGVQDVAKLYQALRRGVSPVAAGGYFLEQLAKNIVK